MRLAVHRLGPVDNQLRHGHSLPQHHRLRGGLLWSVCRNAHHLAEPLCHVQCGRDGGQHWQQRQQFQRGRLGLALCGAGGAHYGASSSGTGGRRCRRRVVPPALRALRGQVRVPIHSLGVRHSRQRRRRRCRCRAARCRRRRCHRGSCQLCCRPRLACAEFERHRHIPLAPLDGSAVSQHCAGRADRNHAQHRQPARPRALCRQPALVAQQQRTQQSRRRPCGNQPRVWFADLGAAAGRSALGSALGRAAVGRCPSRLEIRIRAIAGPVGCPAQRPSLVPGHSSPGRQHLRLLTPVSLFFFSLLFDIFFSSFCSFIGF
eukprot:m.146697 g.146697  ORF g.146697 m.146697 type:complete len:318 (+) comp20546_c0_seq1:1428-2381(+)